MTNKKDEFLYHFTPEALRLAQESWKRQGAIEELEKIHRMYVNSDAIVMTRKSFLIYKKERIKELK